MSRLWYTLRYAVYLVTEILTSSLRVAGSVLTPRVRWTPAIIELPLRCRTDLEITTMASSITLTPGTLTLGIAPAGPDHPPTLFVHALYGADLAAVHESLEDMERRLLLATRGRGGSTR